MDENNFILKIKNREAATYRILGSDDFFDLMRLGCQLGASREMFSYVHTADEGNFIRFNPVTETQNISALQCLS